MSMRRRIVFPPDAPTCGRRTDNPSASGVPLGRCCAPAPIGRAHVGAPIAATTADRRGCVALPEMAGALTVAPPRLQWRALRLEGLPDRREDRPVVGGPCAPWEST